MRDSGNGRAVALAPRLVCSAGLTARHPRGWKAALRVRGIGDRPATEDASRGTEERSPERRHGLG